VRGATAGTCCPCRPYRRGGNPCLRLSSWCTARRSWIRRRRRSRCTVTVLVTAQCNAAVQVVGSCGSVPLRNVRLLPRARGRDQNDPQPWQACIDVLSWPSSKYLRESDSGTTRDEVHHGRKRWTWWWRHHRYPPTPGASADYQDGPGVLWCRNTGDVARYLRPGDRFLIECEHIPQRPQPGRQHPS